MFKTIHGVKVFISPKTGKVAENAWGDTLDSEAELRILSANCHRNPDNPQVKHAREIVMKEHEIIRKHKEEFAKVGL